MRFTRNIQYIDVPLLLFMNRLDILIFDTVQLEFRKESSGLSVLNVSWNLSFSA